MPRRRRSTRAKQATPTKPTTAATAPKPQSRKATGEKAAVVVDPPYDDLQRRLRAVKAGRYLWPLIHMDAADIGTQGPHTHTQRVDDGC